MYIVIRDGLRYVRIDTERTALKTAAVSKHLKFRAI